MQQLFERYLKNQCSPDEVKFLLKEFEAGQNEDLLKSLIRQQLEDDFEINSLSSDATKNLLSETYKNIQDQLTTGRKPQSAPVIPLFRRTWFRVAAAAVVVFLFTGAYLLFVNKAGKDAEIAGKPEITNDVKAPEVNKAIITLVDGRTVALDSLTSGLLAQQGNVRLVKLADGQIAYQSESGEIFKELQYNTLTNPRGSKVVDMTLADGSHVWLNAGSSITYPVAFVGNERKVSITGEAYFEIAHNANKPFYVNKGDIQVEVLGTHFNVNAYDDEDALRVTLLEGSVKVSSLITHQSLLIKPGQQTEIINNQLSIINNPDLEQVMAWKNNLFVFTGDKIQTVMRELSRWYDIDVQYSSNVTSEDFVGMVSRSENISQVLKTMETTKKVKFEISGRKVIVVSP